MTDQLAEGVAWLQEQRRAHMVSSVIYARGASTVSDVSATVGQTIFRLEDGAGPVEYWESRDYLIDAADLTSLGEPEAGDRITQTLNGTDEIFEVMAPADEAPWRWSDAHGRTVYRIHTKYVGPAATATASSTASATEAEATSP